MKAVILGASGGLGNAFVKCVSLQYEHVFAISRSHIDFKTDNVSQYQFENLMQLEDIASQIKEQGDVSLVIIAVGMLHSESIGPEKRLQDCEVDAMQQLHYTNAVLPTMMMKYFLPCLTPSEGKLVVLSAKVGSIEDNRLGGWYSYRSSKASLNMLLKSAAIEHKRIAPNHVLVAMHPGTVDTGLSQPFHGRIPPSQIISPDDSVRDMIHTISGLDPSQSGSFIDRFGKVIPW